LLARRWLLNQANGTRDLITIAEWASLPLALLAEQADVLWPRPGM
jgi:aminopeptidase-like protein